MEYKDTLIGITFIVLGTISIVKPALFIEYQKWVSKKLYSAEYKPSDKTYNIRRVIGVIFLIVGITILAL